MLKHIRNAVIAWKMDRHVKNTVAAIEVAKREEASPIADVAWQVAAKESEAAERCREILHREARTHIGRLAR